jgi:hypothetical protein
MIVIPEKVVFIKVPKAASTTIARLFWDKYGVEQFAHLKPDVAAQIRYFMSLEQVGPQIPVLNGNWFYNRSGAFGWHTAYDDLNHLFGDQLEGFHWVASVRHPVSRLFSAFSFQIAKKRIKASLCSGDFERFCDEVFSGGARLTHQQRIHTWSQSRWLPREGADVDFSIIRQERIAEDIAELSARIPSFESSALGHVGSSFKGAWREHVSPELEARIEAHYEDDMTRFGY